jgi:hypothetical protein
MEKKVDIVFGTKGAAQAENALARLGNGLKDLKKNSSMEGIEQGVKFLSGQGALEGVTRGLELMAKAAETFRKQWDLVNAGVITTAEAFKEIARDIPITGSVIRIGDAIMGNKTREQQLAELQRALGSTGDVLGAQAQNAALRAELSGNEVSKARAAAMPEDNARRLKLIAIDLELANEANATRRDLLKQLREELRTQEKLVGERNKQTQTQIERNAFDKEFLARMKEMDDIEKQGAEARKAVQEKGKAFFTGLAGSMMGAGETVAGAWKKNQREETIFNTRAGGPEAVEGRGLSGFFARSAESAVLGSIERKTEEVKREAIQISGFLSDIFDHLKTSFTMPEI